MYRRTFALLIGVLAAAVFAAGCGDDDSSASLTKAEFVKQGDAICKEANKEGADALGAYLKKEAGGGLPNPEQEQELISTVVVPLLQKQVDGLNDLGIPEDKKVSEFVEELESVLTEAEENPVGTTASGTPFAESESMAQALGFEACGHN
jgi:hypothetical protein